MRQHLGQLFLVDIHSRAAKIGPVPLRNLQHLQQRLGGVFDIVRRSVRDLVRRPAGVHGAGPNDERGTRLEVQTGVVRMTRHERHPLGHPEIVVLGAAARSCVHDQAGRRDLGHDAQKLGEARDPTIAGVDVDNQNRLQRDAVAGPELVHHLHRFKLLFAPVRRVLPVGYARMLEQ